MAQEHIRKYTVGDVEIWRIVEVFNHEDPFAMLLDGGSPELARQFDWLFPNFATDDAALRINFQAFVIRCGDRHIMIDTCLGNDRDRQFPIFNQMQTTFLADIASVGCPAERIDTVLCTHLHFDHTGWNTKLENGRFVPTFPNARYLFGREEWEHLQHDLKHGTQHYLGHVEDSITPVYEAGLVDFIESDHRITDEIVLFSTPGHTAGHVSIRIESKGETAVITGDMMHHPIQVALPTHPGNFDDNKPLAGQTRLKFMQETAGTDTLVIGSHFCDPTCGYIRGDGNGGWRFDISSLPKGAS
jgi:glyoxylase-like metal-dependent hydrolase (beta-lactamase superfamily II)